MSSTISVISELESEVLRSNNVDPGKFNQWLVDDKSTYSVDKMWVDTIKGVTYLKWQWAANEYLTFWLDFKLGCIHLDLEKTRGSVCHFKLGPILASVNSQFAASFI
jgi:hypothetical protein